MPIQEVWIIRHGQTDWNVQHRWQGHVPTSLNDVGMDQARRLADYLGGVQVGKIFTSDLPRAYQTAQPLAELMGIKPIKDERLREIDVGIFQALFPDEMETYYPSETAAWRSGDLDYQVPCGESRRMMQTRACNAFDEITQQDLMSPILIFTHGGTIRQMLEKICEGDPLLPERISVPNTSRTVLRRNKNGWEIQKLADTAHLDDNRMGDNFGEAAV